uniref:Uncharacterized protein n=1 Tax=Romanomermis culicivorax TaxID=13658 RepID=A0A915J291_ROMCU
MSSSPPRNGESLASKWTLRDGPKPVLCSFRILFQIRIQCSPEIQHPPAGHLVDYSQGRER